MYQKQTIAPFRFPTISIAGLIALTVTLVQAVELDAVTLKAGDILVTQRNPEQILHIDPES